MPRIERAEPTRLRATRNTALFLAALGLASSRLHAQAPTAAPDPVLQPQVSALLTGPGSRLWTYSSAVENWIGRVVSVGNGGTEVLSQFGPLTDYIRMLSSYDGDPALPAWQVQESSPTLHHSVDSAEDHDRHVCLYDRPEPGNPTLRRVVLRKYERSQSNADWSYEWPVLTNGHPQLYTRISKDGQTIVAVVHNIYTGKEDVAVFGPSSNAPLRTFSVDVLGPAKMIELSADGRILAVPGDIRLLLADTTTMATLFTTTLFSQNFLAHGLSGDGSIYCYGGNNFVKVLRRSATTGTYSLAYTNTLAGNCYCDHLDVSADGSTVACAFNFTDNWNKVVVQALDLNTYALTMTDTVIGSGMLQNVCSSVSVSQNGSRFAIGLWGDELGQSPEVRVYERNASTPLWTYDLPGSVNELDLSADGRRLAVASKAVHANIVGGGGRIDLFQVGDEDISVAGQPHAGSAVTISTRGRPTSPAILLLAPSLANSPITFPTLGTLYLSRTTLSTLPMGTFDAQGLASVSLTLPATVGTTLYLQGYSSSPRRLGQSFLKVTTLP